MIPSCALEKASQVLRNPLFLDALACNNSSRAPIWMMRQAGRYMSSYRALRSKYSFLQLCHEPDLIREVTLLPIVKYGFDAAILFSDILIIAEALGVGLRFEDSIGPVIERPLKTLSDVEALPHPVDLSGLSFVGRGIQQVKTSLSVPLIGFCGAPFTVASYMIEGKSSKNFKKTKQMLFNDPMTFHRLMKLISDWSIGYLNMQIDAGVDAIQIFDSWANALAMPQFREFCLPYYAYIMNGLKKRVPLILFCKGASVFANQIATIHPNAIGLDWNCDVSEVRQVIPYPIALQGNLDPDVLYAPHSKIIDETLRILDSMKGDKGFIFNLGHGIHPDIPEDSVKVLVETVKNYS